MIKVVPANLVELLKITCSSNLNCLVLVNKICKIPHSWEQLRTALRMDNSVVDICSIIMIFRSFDPSLISALMCNGNCGIVRARLWNRFDDFEVMKNEVLFISLSWTQVQL